MTDKTPRDAFLERDQRIYDEPASTRYSPRITAAEVHQRIKEDVERLKKQKK
jgi:hypothetical protein